MVLLIAFGVAFTLCLAYIVYTLVSSYGSEYTDTSFDAFISRPASSESEQGSGDESCNVNKQHRWSYDEPGRQLLILYGTEYGFAKELAQELFHRIVRIKEANDRSQWQPRVVNATHFSRVDFSKESVVFVIVSTAGDGVPPTEAREFVQWLASAHDDASFSHLKYSVLALGDSNYLHFCRAGRVVDDRLLEIGATRIVHRRDVDAEDRKTINQWFDEVLGVLDTVTVKVKEDYLCADDFHVGSSTGPSRECPFSSVLKVKFDLTNRLGCDDKETIHCEFDVTNSGIKWTAGDALGIYPQNCSREISDVLDILGWTGSELIDVPSWAYHPKPDGQLTVEQAFLHYYDLKNLKPELLSTLGKYSKEGTSSRIRLQSLLEQGLYKDNVRLGAYLGDRDLADVLCDFNDAAQAVTVNDLFKQLKMLLPRYYSISSSPFQDPNTVCVTAAVVRYNKYDRDRIGVTTTYLQDRLSIGQSCPVFISQNPDFRLPSDGSRPIVMIGPGTGLAPFRAFIQERILRKDTGQNLLYFGCRRSEQDFLYKTQLEQWVRLGALELRTAFSRDQPRKIYVQDLLRADEDTIWRLLHSSFAHIYVCGDARLMAADVHQVLLEIVKSKGHFTDDDAVSYLSQLELAGRYQKDVWLS